MSTGTQAGPIEFPAGGGRAWRESTWSGDTFDVARLFGTVDRRSCVREVAKSITSPLLARESSVAALSLPEVSLTQHSHSRLYHHRLSYDSVC